MTFNNLPDFLKSIIFTYDSTYHEIFDLVMLELVLNIEQNETFRVIISNQGLHNEAFMVDVLAWSREIYQNCDFKMNRMFYKQFFKDLVLDELKCKKWQLEEIQSFLCRLKKMKKNFKTFADFQILNILGKWE